LSLAGGRGSRRASRRRPGGSTRSGAALVTAVAALVLVLLQARSTSLPATAVAVAAVAAVLATIASAFHVRRRPDGFLPLELVRNGVFLRHALVGFTLFAGYLAMLFVA
jgi:hypothetical protein